MLLLRAGGQSQDNGTWRRIWGVHHSDTDTDADADADTDTGTDTFDTHALHPTASARTRRAAALRCCCREANETPVEKRPLRRGRWAGRLTAARSCRNLGLACVFVCLSAHVRQNRVLFFHLRQLTNKISPTMHMNAIYSTCTLSAAPSIMAAADSERC